MDKLTGSRWFNLASWGITAVLVAAMLGFVLLRRQPPLLPVPAVTVAPVVTQAASPGAAPLEFLPGSLSAIARKLTFKTIIPKRPRYAVVTHVVEPGDSVFGIAKAFGITPDSLLWANYDVLNDSPDSLRPGQE